MHVVIMAGGAGTRFWPLSRESRPKQMLNLFGDRPMIAETVHRVEGWARSEDVVVVTSASLAETVAELVPELPRENILSEPVGRNTAPCIGWAATWILERTGDPSEVVVVLPADHYVRDRARFQETLTIAAEAARGGAIVTLGIEPTRPETGYGYIQRGSMESDGTANVVSFVEKPDRETALRYLADGSYVWNAGIFCFRVDTILAEIERQLPLLHSKLLLIREAMRAGDADAVAAVFEQITPVSIDYGVMENAQNVRVVPAMFGWSDVGHWDALTDVADTDDDGNVVMGDVVAIDCTGSVLLGHESRVLAAVGLKDYIAIDSVDAVLVAPRSRSQEVRAVVDALRRRGSKKL